MLLGTFRFLRKVVGIIGRGGESFRFLTWEKKREKTEEEELTCCNLMNGS